VKGGIRDLLGALREHTVLAQPIHQNAVLKSAGSAFENFWTDEHTTLVPVNDRIFSTSIDLTYTFADIPLPTPTVCRLSCFRLRLFSQLNVQDDKKLEWSLQSAGPGDVWDGARYLRVIFLVIAHSDSFRGRCCGYRSKYDSTYVRNG
jgi:hypothetical protein